MSNFIGYKLDFVEFVCEGCGQISRGKTATRKYCDDCRQKRHLEAKSKSQKAIYEYNKALLAERNAAPVQAKPKFTLAEVNEAARKNGMTYGNYVYQLSIGKVEPPEKLQKKKRGRKKNDRS